MDFVDIEDGALLGSDAFHDRLEAFLKVAAVLRTGNERAEVKLVDLDVPQRLGHIGIDDALSQAINNRGLAHSRLADVQRIVLVLAAQHLDGAVKFLFTADKGVVVGKVVVDAQHIVTPRSRPGHLRLFIIFDLVFYNIVDECFIVIVIFINNILDFILVIVDIVVNFITSIGQATDELSSVSLLDHHMQAVGGKRVLQFIEHFHHVGNISHLDGCREAMLCQFLQENLILIGKHDLGCIVILRDSLHIGNALTQFLGNGTDEHIRGHLVERSHHLGVSQCYHQDVLGRYQPRPVHAGQCDGPGQDIVKFAGIF